MKKYIAKIKKYINDVKNINTKEFLVTHKNALIVIIAIVLLGGIITAASYAYYQTLANQSIVGGQVGVVSNLNIYVYAEDKNSSTGAGLGTYSRYVYIPQYGYSYNSSLSYCKKGSTLTYIGGKFLVSNSRDTCYVYFDVSLAANADITLNVYIQKNGEYKMINGIPSGYYELNNNSSCTNGATMTIVDGRKIIVDSTGKAECNAYLDKATLQVIYRRPPAIDPMYLANYGSSAASSYPSSISGLTLNTDYYNQPDSSWDYYLKHEIDTQGRIIYSYACFKNGGIEYCLKGADGGESYTTNRSLLLNTTFTGLTCTDNMTYTSCNGQYFIDDIFAYSNGEVKTSDDILEDDVTDHSCYVNTNGASNCASWRLPPTVTTEYWTDYFTGTYRYSYTLGQKSTDGTTWTNGSPTTYSSLQLLLNNYYGVNDSYSGVRAAAYIKTTTEHQACLYYNNYEFCISPNYWDTNSNTTATKLQNDMYDAFGYNLNCDGYAGFSQCFLNNDKGWCESDEDGSVYCDGAGDNCKVFSDGSAQCTSW